MLSRKTLLICLAALLPAAAKAQLNPQQIFDRYVTAHQTLNFSEVAPYIHSHTLSIYRKTTSAVIKHAVDKFGEDAVVEFFQGTPLLDLNSFSDKQNWAFVMASSQQFSTEKPRGAVAPVAEFWDGPTQYFLVYPAGRSLLTAPEMGSFKAHLAYGFEQENGIWKMRSFVPNAFEAALYWYLQRKLALKPA
ncbi:MAG: hypothetical protein QOE73_2161 [Verrucomicrobiota bacterium]